MREVIGALILAFAVAFALVLMGAPVGQVAADALRPALRLAVAAAVGFAIVRVACGPNAQIDEAIRATGAYGSNTEVRGKAILGISLILAAALIASGSVI